MNLEFIYRKDEPNRIARLASVIVEIAEKMPKETQYINSIEDDKGKLIITFDITFLNDCFNVKIIDLIKNIWESKNEYSIEVLLGNSILFSQQ